MQQRQEWRLLRDIPFRIPWTVVRENREIMRLRPRAKPRAGHGREMLDNSGAISFEEEILVRLLIVPQSLRFLLQFGPRADCYEDPAAGVRLFQRLRQARAIER